MFMEHISIGFGQYGYKSEFTYLEQSWTHNHYMAVTVKVQFKDKLYKLAQHTHTLTQLQQEMSQRFPHLHKLQYFYQNTQVTDLSLVLAKAAKQGLSSIKLVAKVDSADASQLNQTSIAANSERNDSSIISLLAQDTSKTQVLPRSSLPSEFYICYNCQGAKLLRSGSAMEVCGICKGSGKIAEGHKYVNRLRELYFKHFRPAEQAQMLLQNLSQEPAAQRKNSFAKSDKHYEVIVREVTKKETVQVGKIFSMKFQIKNIGASWQNKPIEIVEIGQDKGKTISALKTDQTVEVQLGPFLCTSEGTLEKTYVLCYRDGDSLVRFGHKFGFSVRGIKPKAVRKMVSSQRERIRDLKMLSGSSKSQEYLSLKLKSMGIDVMNLQMEDEVILEVIKQFK